MAQLTPTVKQPAISQLVREIRCQMKLSQEKFAAKLGVAFQTVNRWENGRVEPSAMALKLIQGILLEMGECGEDLLKRYFTN